MKLTEALCNAIINDDAVGLQLLLTNLNTDERQLIIESELDRAALDSLGLLNEENDDEYKRLFRPHKSQTTLIRPLWLAAYKGCGRVAEVLLSSGADVNAQSGCLLASTALSVACRRDNRDVIKLLLTHGAVAWGDNGVKCLTFCIHHVNVDGVDLLVSVGGADPNGRNEYGNCLLNAAICGGNLAVIKSLINHGADVNQRDCRNDDSLAIACRRKNRDIVDFILEKMNAGIERRIDAYQLHGASYVLCYGQPNIASCFLTLNKAFKLRMENYPTSEVQYLEPKAVYHNLEEPRSLQDLDEILSNPHKTYMYCLILQERILGECSHSASLYRRICANKYLRWKNYQRTLELSLHELMTYTRNESNTVRERINNPNFPKENIKAADFWDSDMDRLRNTLVGLFTTGVILKPEIISGAAEDLFKLLTWLSEQIEASLLITDSYHQHRNRNSLPEFDINETIVEAVKEYRRMILNYVIDLITVKLKLETTIRSGGYTIRHLVYRIQKSLARETKKSTTFLHEALKNKSAARFGFKYRILQLFLHCGSVSTDTDENGNTPLHLLADGLASVLKRYPEDSKALDTDDAKLKSFTIRGIMMCAKLLISHGAHLDVRNREGRTALEMFKQCEQTRNYLDLFSFETLQCLTARVLRDVRYPVELIPDHLTDFVLKH